MVSKRGAVTQILGAVQGGDPRATDELFKLVYDELRRLAHHKMARERAGHTLETTDLVHTAYLRLVGDADVAWQNRAHFFAAAAEAMRRILIERARRYRRLKHGGGQERISVADTLDVLITPALPVDELLALDEAITRLEQHDKRKTDVVKLRYFAGLSVEEVALALGVSEATVKNDWSYARAWLKRELSGGEESRKGGGGRES